LFQFVAVASRPLLVEELAELLAFDFEVGPIPKIHEGWRLEDPADAVLATCSSLFIIVDGGLLSEADDGGSLSKTDGTESASDESEVTTASDESEVTTASEAFEDHFFP